MRTRAELLAELSRLGQDTTDAPGLDDDELQAWLDVVQAATDCDTTKTPASVEQLATSAGSQRVLPDGRSAWVGVRRYPSAFVAVIVAHDAPEESPRRCNQWSYRTEVAARAALGAWDGQGDPPDYDPTYDREQEERFIASGAMKTWD